MYTNMGELPCYNVGKIIDIYNGSMYVQGSVNIGTTELHPHEDTMLYIVGNAVVTGNVTANNVTGMLTTAAQPNVTSIGSSVNIVSGNVGIGTTSAPRTLTVAGDIFCTGNIYQGTSNKLFSSGGGSGNVSSGGGNGGTTTTLDDTYPPTSTATDATITTNVATQMYNGLKTPTFYFRWALNSDIMMSSGTLYNWFKLTQFGQKQANYNGISMSSIIDNSTGYITIPMTGVYSFVMTAPGWQGINTLQFLQSISGTYGSSYILYSNDYMGPASDTYVGYFAQGDVVCPGIQYSGSSPCVPADQTQVAVTLISIL